MSLIPCRLATSVTGTWSASRRIFTICSSLNRVFFMAPSLPVEPSSQRISWYENRLAGHLLVIGSWEQAIPRSHAPEEIGRPAVRVVQGKVLGTLVEGGLAFKNLPYAAPPVGPNRWRAPQAASSWRGTRDASVFGPSCPQEPMGWNDVDAKRASEDCL